MSSPTSEELRETINELTDYQQRLIQEVVGIAQKLKMPPKKIDSIVEDHPELSRIKKVLSQLANQLKDEKSN